MSLSTVFRRVSAGAFVGAALVAVFLAGVPGRAGAESVPAQGASQQASPPPGYKPPYNFPDPFGGADVSMLVNRIVTAALSLFGAGFFLMFLWGGVVYMTAQGNPTEVKKAVSTLTNAVIGLAIVASSYAILGTVFRIFATAASATK